MKNIEITQPFHLNKKGLLKEGQEIELENSVADYVVKTMKAGRYIDSKIVKESGDQDQDQDSNGDKKEKGKK